MFSGTSAKAKSPVASSAATGSDAASSPRNVSVAFAVAGVASGSPVDASSEEACVTETLRYAGGGAAMAVFLLILRQVCETVLCQTEVVGNTEKNTVFFF